MNARIRAVLESKRTERVRLAGLPFSEKVALLEQLRDRALSIADSALFQEHNPRGGKAWVLRERRAGHRP